MAKHKKEPQAHLIPDPVEKNIVQEAAQDPLAQEVIPIIKPVSIEIVSLPEEVTQVKRVIAVPLNEEIKEGVLEKPPVKDSIVITDVVVKDIKVLETPEPAKKYPHVHVLVAGINNTISSSVRVFFQQIGMPLFDAYAMRQKSENIIEQYNNYGRPFDFAVVVLSADEVTCQKYQTLEHGLWVSRQETIFDLGFLVGKLGKTRVAVFYDQEQPKFKRPTEYFDLLYTPFDHQGHWKTRLMTQLTNAGLIERAADLIAA